MKYRNKILVGDCKEKLKKLPTRSIHCCVTSPPYYGLREYNVEDKASEIGQEASLQEYIKNLVEVGHQIHRVLRDDATFWLNLGDSRTGGNYRGGGADNASAKQRSSKGTLDLMNKKAPPIPDGLKKKEWMGVPWRVAFALQDAGWYLSDTVIWRKNSMPTSARDRTCRNFEDIFMFTKQPHYFYDQEAIKEPATSSGSGGLSNKNTSKRRGTGLESDINYIPAGMRNKRSVWDVAIASVKEAHFACFPTGLVTPMIQAGTSEKGCCSKCGNPYVRQVEKERTATRPGRDTKVTGNAAAEGNRDPQRHVTVTRTVGWSLSCKCNADTVPCLVLDPFFGAGSTGVASKELGRDFVGVELSKEYCKIAQGRIIRGK